MNTSEKEGGFDRVGALKRVGEDENIYRELVKVFLDDTPISFRDLVGTIEAENIVQTERLAHSLKSASATVGAVRLSELAFELEKAAHNKNKAVFQGLLARLNDELKSVIPVLESVLKPL